VSTDRLSASGRGELRGRIDTSGIRGELALWYDLGLPLDRGKLVVTFIPLTARRWDALAGTVAAFGDDAGTMRDGVRIREVGAGRLDTEAEQIPIHVTRLEVDQVSAAEASAHVRCDLAADAAEQDRQSSWSVDGWVSLGAVDVRGSLRTPPPDPTQARAMASRFLDLDRYEIKLDDGLVQLWPRTST
jgi:hypothetical protein